MEAKIDGHEVPGIDWLGNGGKGVREKVDGHGNEDEDVDMDVGVGKNVW